MAFFPESQSGADSEYFRQLKKHTSLVLDQILGKDRKQDLEAVEDEIFSRLKPQNYSGKNGIEVNHIKGFKETCILLLQHVPKDPESMTVLEFYQALETVKNQSKERKKSYGK